MRVKPDAISIAFDIIALLDILFYTTFGGSLFTGSVVAALLIIAGIGLDRPPINPEDDEEEEETTGPDLTKIGAYTIGAIAVFFALTTFVPAIPPQYKPFLSIQQGAVLGVVSVGALFVIQIAVSEAEFFHKFLLNFFASRLPAFVAFPIIGAIGSVYHFEVYGDSVNNLLIIFGAFSTLAYVAWATGRVSPVVLAHVLNNALASGLISLGSVGIVLPGSQAVFGLTFPTLVLGLSALLCVAAIRLNSTGTIRRLL